MPAFLHSIFRDEFLHRQAAVPVAIAKLGGRLMDFSGRGFAWVSAIGCGLLLVAAFQPIAWWGCGWLALAPAWFVLRQSPSVRQNPFRYGYVIGVIFVSGCFWWVGGVTLSGLLVMTLAVACFPGLWFLLVARTLHLPEIGAPLSIGGATARAALAAAFWVVLEWLRRTLMSGFIWNELGVSQVPSLHFRQLASLGGPALLSFVLAGVGILVGEALCSASEGRRRPAALALLAGLFVLAASYAYGWERVREYQGEPERGAITYSCIQPNIPELPYTHGSPKQIDDLEFDAMVQQQKLSALAIRGHPDLLIWPEAITTQQFLPNSYLSQVTERIAAHYDGSLLLGAEEVEHRKLYNTAFLLRAGQPVQRYRKVYLVILGEYLPLADLFPWIRQWWGGGVSATPGTVPGHLKLTRENLSFAPLICFEDTEPQVVDAAAALRPDFFVTLINAGWYAGPLARWCLTQHLENAALRCVEHDLPMIRCADTGISCEIDAEGTVVAQLPANLGSPLEVRGILAGRLSLRPQGATLFDQWGDWVVLLCQVAMLCAGVSYLLKPRPPNARKYGTER